MARKSHRRQRRHVKRNNHSRKYKGGESYPTFSPSNLKDYAEPEGNGVPPLTSTMAEQEHSSMPVQEEKMYDLSGNASSSTIGQIGDSIKGLAGSDAVSNVISNAKGLFGLAGGKRKSKRMRRKHTNKRKSKKVSKKTRSRR